MGQRRWALLVMPMLASVALAACGDGGDTASPDTAAVADDSIAPAAASTTTVAATTTVTPGTDVPTTLAAATTTEAPTTTETPTTTVAPTTTAALTAADLDLDAAAIGPVTFGTGVDAALAVLVPVLGTPSVDVTDEFPTALDGGSWTNDEEGIFAFPHLRRLCFANGLCISFGAATPTDLQLVGYDYGSPETPAGPQLTTVTGVPMDARWSDYLDAMTAFPGGCYSQGYGDAGGVTLLLVSDGDPFLVVDQTTFESISQVPDPSMVTVYGMFAGDNPGFLYDDC